MDGTIEIEYTGTAEIGAGMRIEGPIDMLDEGDDACCMVLNPATSRDSAPVRVVVKSSLLDDSMQFN